MTKHTKLSQQANDLLERLAEAKRDLRRAAPDLAYDEYKRREAQLDRLIVRSYNRLVRRLGIKQYKPVSRP